MNSRSSSFSVPAQRLQQRPSFSSRLSFAVSNAEQGEAAAASTVAEHQIDEEIEEIKRYEVCAWAISIFAFQPLLIYLSIGFHNNRYFPIAVPAMCQTDFGNQIGSKMLPRSN